MKRETQRAFLISGIFAIAIAGAIGLSKLKPAPDKKDITSVDPLVEVLSLIPSTETFRIASQGTVRPRTETTLSAEVSGVIVEISPKFIAGGVFSAGEELLRIDQTNYVVVVDQAAATLVQRQIEYDGAARLRTQGYRAESEYASAAAALATAKAALVSAQRNLERTQISLPYDGMVRAKVADIGQFVNPGTQLGVTFATDSAEVRLPLTDQDLAFVDLPDASDIKGSGEALGPLVVFTAIQKGSEQTWMARVVRTEGVVDEKNRVTYAVASILDPYNLDSGSGNRTALPMGTFVAADIEGATVADVVRVPRKTLRANNQVMFIDSNDRILMGGVDVMRADGEYAYLRGSTLPEKRISMTVIELPMNGMKVRTTAATRPDMASVERLNPVSRNPD